MIKEKLLEINSLEKIYNKGKANEVKAVRDITFAIYKGETFGLVGESGCGKSTTGRVILQLDTATNGEIIYRGRNINSLMKRKDILKLRKEMQIIFQDPKASLNPRMKIKKIIGRGLRVHHLCPKQEIMKRVCEALDMVGLSKEYAERYPHELSGGQCQRVGIARALILDPVFVIADEAISALDVSIQAQIVNLMKKLKKEKGLTYLFIAHDLSMVKYISDRIGVMYSGRLLEIADSAELYHSPLHPYTESLISAIPRPDPLFEKNRQRLLFDPNKDEGMIEKTAQLREIVPGHFVYCTETEVQSYRKKYDKLQCNK